jgi:hypothetical protein
LFTAFVVELSKADFLELARADSAMSAETSVGKDNAANHPEPGFPAIGWICLFGQILY